jgi:hypothetical protein
MEFPSDSHGEVLPPGLSFQSRCEDRPFDSRLALYEHCVPRFGLTPRTKARLGRARRCVLANLLSLRREQWCFYSRDNNHYAKLGRYAPDFYGRRWIAGAVDELEMAGLIEHELTRPPPSALYRSRMRPTARFLSLASGIPARAVLFAPAEVIILRDRHRSVVHYAETHLTKRMRTDVKEENEFLADFDVGLSAAQMVDAQGFFF